MPELRRWTRNGEDWVCGASDHGPMCRLCRRVDGTLAAILENVDLGRAEYVGIDPDGDPLFRITPAGTQRLKALGVQLIDGKAPAVAGASTEPDLGGQAAPDHTEDSNG